MPREMPVGWTYTMQAVSRFADPLGGEVCRTCLLRRSGRRLSPVYDTRQREARRGGRGDVGCKGAPARVSHVIGERVDHNHGYVIETVRTRRRLVATSQYAVFVLPDFIGEIVSVWRGTCGVSAARSRTGSSWTLDHDMACWFAMRLASPERVPLVLRRDAAWGPCAVHESATKRRRRWCVHPPPAWRGG